VTANTQLNVVFKFHQNFGEFLSACFSKTFSPKILQYLLKDDEINKIENKLIIFHDEIAKILMSAFKLFFNVYVVADNIDITCV
jgi:hypothetical protein